ncbi:MAG: hypothetical protein RL318_2760 [Fibrobacterota bacterium]|jgi:hypothetical protein
MRGALLLLVSLLFLSCSDGVNSVAGGSGTGAGNALTVTARAADGATVAGAIVELWPAGQVPPDQGSAPAMSGTTAPDGTISFAVDTGAWSILVRRADAAFHLVSRGGASVSGTLRAISSLTGFVAGAEGGRVALPGLGRSVRCDSTGFFRLDSLPSGTLDWIAVGIGGTTVAGSSTLLPGQTMVASASGGAIAVDTLLRGIPVGTGFARGLPGDTGAFALAMQVRPSDTASTSWFLEWTSGTGRGVRLGLAAPDTLMLELDSTTYMAAGYRLGEGPSRVGLRWTGSGWEVWIDGKQAIKAAMATGTDRRTWTEPVLGGRGTKAIDWLVLRKGLVPDAWFGPSLP